jgi:hypothetical protein
MNAFLLTEMSVSISSPRKVISFTVFEFDFVEYLPKIFSADYIIHYTANEPHQEESADTSWHIADACISVI